MIFCREESEGPQRHQDLKVDIGRINLKGILELVLTGKIWVSLCHAPHLKIALKACGAKSVVHEGLNRSIHA